MRFLNADVCTNFADTFAPFRGLFGADLKSPFNGTLFRFPFRSAETSRQSEISSEIFTRELQARLCARLCAKLCAKLRRQ